MISNNKIRRAQAAADAVFERMKAGDHSARIESPETFGSLGPLIESHNRVLALAEAAGVSEPEVSIQKRALETAAQVCQRASAGDLEARITNTEEFGDLHSLLDAINHLLDVTDAFVRESSASLEFAGQRKFWRPFLLRGMPGDFRRGAQVIDHARQAMEQRHNLTEAFQATVSHVAGVVSEAAKALEGTANEMNGNAEATRTQSVAVSSASDRTATNTQAVAAGAEELSAAIGEISQQTSATMKAVQGIVSETVRANEAAAQLAGAAQKIDRVVKFIAEVAGQTNLLALNATIEAARAGELGRGFAVVAGEVKGLATQARNATSEISALMAEVQSASDATAAAIKLIDERVHGMREMTTAIASAVEQQSAATMEISRNVQEAASGSGEVSRSVSMIASASEATGKAAGLTLDSARRLSGEADALDGKVRDFLVKIRQA